MLTGGRILSHLFKRLSNKNDCLLFVGFQALGTRGRDILNKAESIKIYGENVSVQCKIAKIDGLSAHADQEELIQYFESINATPKYTFLVHGEWDAMNVLKAKLEAVGASNIYLPDYLESFELFQSI